MSSANQVIWKLLESDAALRRDLSRGVVNTRALARWLIKKHGLGASTDAAISAIRRFQESEKPEEKEKAFGKVFKGSQIATRNSVACLTIAETGGKVLERLAAFRKPFKISGAGESTKLLVSQQHLESLRELFPKKDVLKAEKDLSEISVILSTAAWDTPGVLARMSSELALADINIQEMVVCPPEISLYVSQKDIIMAHDSILKLVE